MTISDRDDINHRELARVLGISVMAALRGGHFSARQQRTLERIAEGAEVRESEKREIRRAAQQAADDARFQQRKQKAVDKAVGKVTKKPGFSWW